MEDIMDLKKIKQPNFVINPDLNKYENVNMFSEKLKAANEILEKYPIPANIYLDSFSKIEQEVGFEVKGILKRADASKNSFLVIEMDGSCEINYNIQTESKTLNKIVKAFWGEQIRVHIRPKINENNLFEYELIEIKID
jgi:hypothetical protein